MRTFANLKRKRIGSDFNLLDYSFGRRFPKPKNPGLFCGSDFFVAFVASGMGLSARSPGCARYFKKDMREFLIYNPFKSP